HQPREEARFPGHGRWHLRLAEHQLAVVRGVRTARAPPGEHRGPERFRDPDHPDDLLPGLGGAVLRLPDGTAPIRVDQGRMTLSPQPKAGGKVPTTGAKRRWEVGGSRSQQQGFSRGKTSHGFGTAPYPSAPPPGPFPLSLRSRGTKVTRSS